MKKLFSGLLLLTVAACGSNTAQNLAVACSVDGALQPVAAAALTAAGQGGAATADALVVHPLVVAACKTVGGTPVAAPAASVTPAS